MAARVSFPQQFSLFFIGCFIPCSDPYVHFKSPPLNGVQLVVLPDDGVMSSGLVYIHNAQPNGAANWVLRQARKNSLLFVPPQQQTACADCLISRLSGAARRSRRTSGPTAAPSAPG